MVRLEVGRTGDRCHVLDVTMFINNEQYENLNTNTGLLSPGLEEARQLLAQQLENEQQEEGGRREAEDPPLEVPEGVFLGAHVSIPASFRWRPAKETFRISWTSGIVMYSNRNVNMVIDTLLVENRFHGE